MVRGGSYGYDQHITIFSPEGRLFQVEYAHRASKLTDSTCIISKNANSVVAIVFRKKKTYQKGTYSEFQIFPITNLFGCVYSGFPGDIQMKIQELTKEYTKYFEKYQQSIPLDYIAKRISDTNQVFTQYAYMRPLATTMVIMGIDEEIGPQIFKCEPSGYCSSHNVCAIGEKASLVNSQIIKKVTKKLKKAISYLNACSITTSILIKILNYEVKPDDIDIIISSREKLSFYRLNKKEKEEVLSYA